MRRIWRLLLGLKLGTVLLGVELDDDAGVVVARVRPARHLQGRCGVCRRPSSRYDAGDGPRRWRTLDVGVMQAFLQADAPRVACSSHGVTVAAVPWARHGARHTLAFDDTVTWLATRCSKTAVTELLRVGWRTVGRILTRVLADLDADGDRLDGLRRIGIDEISHRKGRHYLTVVVDHDSGRLVWAQPGRDDATLARFFDALGPDRVKLLTHVSGDGADWIRRVVAKAAGHAVLCADPFHVVRWATQALDEVRREVWNEVRRLPGGQVSWGRNSVRPYKLSRGAAQRIQRSRWALWKNPEDLTGNQQAKLEWIAKTSPKLHRAYLLKEGLRHVFKVKGDEGKEALRRWLTWAYRCQIPAFVKLARKIKRHLPAIHASLEHGLSNAIVESVNTRIRLLTRVAFGFHTPQPLIAVAMLSLGGYHVSLPGR